jgi:hypothetical protein
MGEREPLGGDDQGDDYLHTVESFTLAIAVLPLSSSAKGGSLSKWVFVRSYKEDIKLCIEKVSPLPGQVVEKRVFMLDQPVQAPVELMCLRQFKTRPQKIGHCAFLIPVSVKSPLASVVDEAITTESLHDQIPTEPLVTGGIASLPRIYRDSTVHITYMSTSVHPTGGGSEVLYP